MSSYLYAPIFEGNKGEAFLPYEELLSETRSGAKAIGRDHQKDVFVFIGMSYSGRLLRLTVGGEQEYPRIEVKIPECDRPMHLALISGEIYEKAMQGLKEKEGDDEAG
jgi:hypothetical protein